MSILSELSHCCNNHILLLPFSLCAGLTILSSTPIAHMYVIKCPDFWFLKHGITSSCIAANVKQHSRRRKVKKGRCLCSCLSSKTLHATSKSLRVLVARSVEGVPTAGCNYVSRLEFFNVI
jgi:hypothetical protein